MREVMTRIDAREGRSDPMKFERKVGLRRAGRQCQACGQVMVVLSTLLDRCEGHHETKKQAASGCDDH